MFKSRGILVVLLMVFVPFAHVAVSLSYYSNDAPLRLSADGLNYRWIWEELLDSLPSDLEGDDVLYWGEGLGVYYNSQETQLKLQSLSTSFPDLATYFTIGKSYNGKNIPGIKITSPASEPVSIKYEFVLVGAHHAREVITVIDTLYFMDRLVFNYLIGDSWTQSLLKYAEIYIIPVLNPDGLDYTYINPWQRKNLHPTDEDGDGETVDDFEIRDVDGDGYVSYHFEPELGYDVFEGIDGNDTDKYAGEDKPGGIDLNRNYPFEFVGSGSSTSPRADDYRGSEPLSEPETRAWANFATEHHFFTSLSLHSGIQAIISPWGFTSTPPPDDDIFNSLVEIMKDVSGYPTWEEIGGYGVNGEWGDWMYGALDSLAFTVETYGRSFVTRYLGEKNGQSVYGGIWDAFNPPANQIYNVTTGGTQQIIDFLASVPLQNIVPLDFNMTTLQITFPTTNTLRVEWDFEASTPSQFISLETLNGTSFGWQSLRQVFLNETTLSSSFQLEVPKNDWRIYIGSLSQGFSIEVDQETDLTLNNPFDLPTQNSFYGPIRMNGSLPEEVITSYLESRNTTSSLPTVTHTNSQSSSSSFVAISYQYALIAPVIYLLIRKKRKVFSQK